MTKEEIDFKELKGYVKEYTKNLSYPTIFVLLILDLLETLVFAKTLGLAAPISIPLAMFLGFFSVLILQLIFTKRGFSDSLSDTIIAVVLLAIPSPIFSGALLGGKVYLRKK